MEEATNVEKKTWSPLSFMHKTGRKAVKNERYDQRREKIRRKRGN